jgi:hypothetical protein
MTFDNIAVEPRTIIDTQYSIDAAYDAADDTADNRTHRTRIVLTDACAMSGAVRYALSVCAGRHCDCHDASKYYGSNHVYL